MMKRIFAVHRASRLLLAAALLLSATSLDAQSILDQQVSAVESDTLSTAVHQALEEGRTLETSGRWAEALSHYDEAIRKHPQDRNLQARFDEARLHCSFEQRYGDRSFLESVKTLSPRQSLDLYNDLLSKVGANYYTTLPWQKLSRRGGQAISIALADRDFRNRHGIRASDDQITRLQEEIDRLVNGYTIRSRRDATAVASEVAQRVAQRVGLSQTATLLEFTASAAGGLDHYSAFLTADQLRDIYSQIEGNFVGLGVELKADEGALLIVHVIPNSPAQTAGIQDGDRIVEVDGQATAQLSTDEAASLLTGEEGSIVQLAVISPGESPRAITVRRAYVEVPSLEDVKIIDPKSGVAYVRIPAFQKTTSRDLEAAMWDLHRQGMRSLVIDLRGNPGGLLTASVEIADKFIASGSIVSTRGRSSQENFDYRAHRAGTWRVPLVVLIDGDSASASEIFAGAIKDSGRGKIVGSRSFGKGSVQGIFPLGYAGAGARITTAKFFSPKGQPISLVGVSPDIEASRVAAGSTDREHHLVSYRGKENTSGDQALEIAIQAAQREPVAVL